MAETRLATQIKRYQAAQAIVDTLQDKLAEQQRIAAQAQSMVANLSVQIQAAQAQVDTERTGLAALFAK